MNMQFSNYKNIRSAADVLCVVLIYPYKKKNALNYLFKKKFFFFYLEHYCAKVKNEQRNVKQEPTVCTTEILKHPFH